MASPSENTELALRIRNAATPVLRALAAGDGYAMEQVPDLTASVVEQVLRRLRRGPEVDDLELYVKRAARNAFFGWGRHRARHPQEALPSAPSAKPLAAAPAQRLQRTLSSEVVQRDDQRRHAIDIHEAMGNLTAIERAVLHHRFVEHRSSREVAALLGYKSEAVVNTTVGRIKKKLGGMLPESLIGPLLRP